MTNRCAYLQKVYAKVLVRLFEENLPRGLVYLKAKDEPTKLVHTPDRNSDAT